MKPMSLSRAPAPRRWAGAAALLSLSVLLAACESTPLGGAKAPVESRNPVLASAQPPATAPAAGSVAAGTAPQSQVATVDLNAARNAAAEANAAAAQVAAAQRVVYFDFDSFAIKDEYKPVLDAHARLMAAPPAGRRLVVEGHTDARGGSEYNLALGQKRAESVVRALALLGVPDSRLEAVSFGKERPAATGNDEQSWARNRRAELRER